MIRRIIHKAERTLESFYEWRLRISTSRVVSTAELGIDGNTDCCEYSPVSYSEFRALRRLMRLTPDSVFLDLGSGMGRAVILAACENIRRVEGVDLSPEMNAIASRNVAAASPRVRCRDIKIVTASAGEYSVPDDVTVAFFYNPFHGQSLCDVLESMRESLLRAPRPFQMVCSLPAGFTHVQKTVERYYFLRKTYEGTLPTGRTCVIYSSHD